jgi:hypothetical protein
MRTAICYLSCVCRAFLANNGAHLLISNLLIQFTCQSVILQEVSGYLSDFSSGRTRAHCKGQRA